MMKKLLIGLTLLASMSAFATFDLDAYEKNLDTAIEQAGMSTDLYFSCSKTGKIETKKLIKKIKDGTTKLPVENAGEIADQLESEYNEIFSCDNTVRKALALGFTNDEIDSAINKAEVKKEQTGASGFDPELFSKQLDEILSDL
jgi:Holliday junction resolvasome RuvABC DNA-binding subunit